MAPEQVEGAEEGFPDNRLNLLFVCAHPAIDETIRAPLMLQTVLGLDAAQIAAAFLVAPSTMGQRLDSWSRFFRQISSSVKWIRLPSD